jgi:hypothetical protein
VSVSDKDVMDLTHSLQQDLRAASAKLVQLRAMLASLPLPTPDEMKCPRCGVRTAGPFTLRSHLANVHDDATALAALKAEVSEAGERGEAA